MSHLIVDTSVLVKWFLVGEALTDQAKRLLHSSLQGALTLHIPLLASIEFGNVLKTQKKISLDQKTRYLNALFELHLETLPFTPQTAMRTLALSHQFDLSYYGALFVALAESTGYKLVTADRKLLKKLNAHALVCFLGDIGAL